MTTPPYGPGNPDPQRVAAYAAYVAQQLDERPFYVQAVFGDTVDDLFAYTVGLTGKNLPELWCAGLNEAAGPVLSVAATFLLEAGAPLAPGTDLRVPSLSVPLRFTAPVDPVAAEVGLARMMHPLSVVSVLQVLWPDEAGRFPDHPDYDSARCPQRILGPA